MHVGSCICQRQQQLNSGWHLLRTHYLLLTLLQYFMSVISFNLPNNDYKQALHHSLFGSTGNWYIRSGWPAHGCLTNWWGWGFRACWLAQPMFPESCYTGYTLGMVPITPISGSQLSVSQKCLWRACQHTGCCAPQSRSFWLSEFGMKAENLLLRCWWSGNSLSVPLVSFFLTRKSTVNNVWR